MIKFGLNIILIISLFSCSKKKLNKIEDTILGKWESKEFYIEEKNDWDGFRSSKGFFTYLTFYPKSDDIAQVYIDFERQENDIAKWGLIQYNKKLTHLFIEPYYLGSTNEFYQDLPFNYSHGWEIKKITNNKLVLISQYHSNRPDYKLVLKKVGKFK